MCVCVCVISYEDVFYFHVYWKSSEESLKMVQCVLGRITLNVFNGIGI